MADESSLQTKTDILDLVISFVMEHEKRMDEIVERLEHLSARMARMNIRGRQPDSFDSILRKPDVFTLTINNPEGYDNIKGIKIEWEDTEKEYTPEISEIDAILDKIDFTFRDDDSLPQK
ncbi:hypothetical protein ES703_07575 [subsurface metagenome]